MQGERGGGLVCQARAATSDEVAAWADELFRALGRDWATTQAVPLLQVNIVLHGVFTVQLCILHKLSLTLNL